MESNSAADRARRLLAGQLPRLVGGIRRISLILYMLFWSSLLLNALRTSDVGYGYVAFTLFRTFAGAVAIWVLAPLATRLAYRPLLERGVLRPARVVSDAESIEAGFGGASTQPWMVSRAIGALATLCGGLVPTRVVRYAIPEEGSRWVTAALYPDESLPVDDVLALVDPKRPQRAWLLRERVDHGG